MNSMKALKRTQVGPHSYSSGVYDNSDACSLYYATRRFQLCNFLCQLTCLATVTICRDLHVIHFYLGHTVYLCYAYFGI